MGTLRAWMPSRTRPRGALGLGGLGLAYALLQALGAAVAAAIQFFLAFHLFVGHDVLLKSGFFRGVRLPRRGDAFLNLSVLRFFAIKVQCPRFPHGVAHGRHAR